MTSSSLRAADPAAATHVTATSVAAEQMLRDILRTPRPEAPAHRGRRFAVGASIVGAAAAAAVGTPLVLAGSGTGAASAYAVDPRSDGSIDIAINFALFQDPAGLQSTLDADGVPAVVLTGSGSTLSAGADGKVHSKYVLPGCARYDKLRADPDDPSDPDQPVSFITSSQFDDTALRLRPDLLPEDGTFVITIYQSDGHVAGLAGDVALGAPPTCLP
jgi:hypothetical protein